MAKMKQDHMVPKVGDRVQWHFHGKTGDSGTVLRVWPRKGKGRQPGGVKAICEVRWDSNEYVGRVEDRKLRPTSYKVCSCGKVYEKADWAKLALLGTQVTDDERYVYRLELKNCPACGSTIGFEHIDAKPGGLGPLGAHGTGKPA